jgi:hypothetical protein
MINYTFSITRLGEKEIHKVKASSKDSDEAWKALALKINMKNVDKILLVSIG